MVEKNIRNTETSKPELLSAKAGKKFSAFIGLRRKEAEHQVSPTIKPEPNNPKLSKKADVKRYNHLIKDKRYLDAAYLALANGLGNGRVKKAANFAYDQYTASNEFLKAFIISKELNLPPEKGETAKFNAFVSHLEKGEFSAASIFAGTSRLSKERILEGITPILDKHKRKANHEAVLELGLYFNVPDVILSLLEDTKRE